MDDELASGRRGDLTVATVGDGVGSDEDTGRGRPSAPAADDLSVHRVIDLAALERQRAGRSDSPADDGATWTVDLDAGVLDRAGAAAHARVDRVSRRLKAVTALLLVAVLALSVVATVSYRRGIAWRNIAIAQRARGEQLEARVAAAQRAVAESEAAIEEAIRARGAAEAQRDAVSGQLAVSEEDVAALEERVAALAGEKARLEDELAVAGQLVRADTEHAAALRRCVAAIDAWLDRAPTDGQVTSWQRWTEESVEWEAGCEVAMGTAGP